MTFSIVSFLRHHFITAIIPRSTKSKAFAAISQTAHTHPHQTASPFPQRPAAGQQGKHGEYYSGVSNPGNTNNKTSSLLGQRDVTMQTAAGLPRRNDDDFLVFSKLPTAE
ncbi:MAG: hypothetical protein LBI59_08625 [Candidatus Accumulibacter sp.]|jgi:hypothetical protein|nr:hypothetical protein [Accumulibacter sp.]